MLETLHTLRVKDRGVLTGRCFARVHRRLSSHRKSVMKAACRKRTWRRVSQSVRKIRQDARQWKPEHRQFGSLAASIRLAHRRGRTAMARARKRQRADDFHEWRKQIKALWYRLRLSKAPVRAFDETSQRFIAPKPGSARARCRGALRRTLQKGRPIRTIVESTLTVSGWSGIAINAALRTKALASTARIYARAPGEYTRPLSGASGRSGSSGRLRPAEAEPGHPGLERRGPKSQSNRGAARAPHPPPRLLQHFSNVIPLHVHQPQAAPPPDGQRRGDRDCQPGSAARIIARSTALRSSRMFPGHG